MALIGLATAAAQVKEVDLQKPSFPQRTTSAPPLKRDISAMLANSPLRSSSVEERQMIRQKISAGYEGRAKTYEELLKICSAIEEELVFISAPSRLDYFKTGLQFDKRVTEKQRQLKGDSAPGTSPEAPIPGEHACHGNTGAGTDMHPAKKVRVSQQIE